MSWAAVGSTAPNCQVVAAMRPSSTAAGGQWRAFPQEARGGEEGSRSPAAGCMQRAWTVPGWRLTVDGWVRARPASVWEVVT